MIHKKEEYINDISQVGRYPVYKGSPYVDADHFLVLLLILKPR
ncbi:hypothetical protein ADIARSV_3442 [Arcticibacter svalbardensis MN12-7]|uniref:Uncharacterized protein n=1 Tax=Arcticibacter svalbardensis MN12-7 TaxID=1150600 RepID=R9GNQ9_9SPHI|nr:hypothetical protein ADIARSV_3442 [Arcticibacter svalbardensis MN12-7]